LFNTRPRNAFSGAFKFRLAMEKYWKIKEETPGYFIFTTNRVSIIEHLIIAIFIGWWTLFIPNHLYHFVMKKNRLLKKSNRY